MVTNTQLEIIARIINKTVNPESVFLFGSYAEGTPNENSDLDIAIIKNTVEDKHEVSPPVPSPPAPKTLEI